VQFNVSQREIVLKVVYYGPPLSGKTTNLQSIHRLLSPSVCGRLTTLDTADDRTLFFDLLPVVLSADRGYTLKLKLFTVPGQVIHAATRRLVLSGADGVVFVADSQLAEARVNNEYWHGMRHYLTETGLDALHLPTVVQFNKRDLPDIRSDQELERLRLLSPEPLYGAVAIAGTGVLETLEGLLGLMIADLNRRYDFERKFEISAGSFMQTVLRPRAAGELS
jgi:signal recognition particle receptor subunit beta